MKDFLKINETRIRISCIKKYVSVDPKNLRIHYSASKNNPDCETFIFTSVQSRNKIIKELDIHFIN